MKVASQIGQQFVHRFLASAPSHGPVQDPEQILDTGLGAVYAELGQGSGNSDALSVVRKMRGEGVAPAQQLGCLATIAGCVGQNPQEVGPQAARVALQAAGHFEDATQQEAVCEGAKKFLMDTHYRNSALGASVSAICLGAPTAAIALREISLLEQSGPHKICTAAAQFCQETERQFSRGQVDGQRTDNGLATIAQMAHWGAGRGDAMAETMEKATQISYPAQDKLGKAFHAHGLLRAISAYRGPQTDVAEMAREILGFVAEDRSLASAPDYYAAAWKAVHTLMAKECDLPGMVADPKLALQTLAA